MNRAKGFWRYNHFFNLLEKLSEENQLGVTRICNVDECGLFACKRNARK
jgi:hypothetical protein